jgi:hypothetical protein
MKIFLTYLAAFLMDEKISETIFKNAFFVLNNFARIGFYVQDLENGPLLRDDFFLNRSYNVMLI